MSSDSLNFKVVDTGSDITGKNELILVVDRWNDWFVWVTQFYLVVFLDDGSRLDVGSVKIGRQGMHDKDGVTKLPANFQQLDHDFFSIGQSENYYETLSTLGEGTRLKVLEALQDCALSLARFERFKDEPVMTQSLLRDIDAARVRSRLHRLAEGTAALTEYRFSYTLPSQSKREVTPTLDFDVMPESTPPTNVHVIIGRNGVGKTRLFDLLARTFLKLPGKDGDATGRFVNRTDPLALDDDQHGFAGLVTVSFSVFDTNGPLVPPSGSVKFRYSYIGLLRFQSEAERRSNQPSDADRTITQGPGSPYIIKTPPELAHEFVQSVEACREGARRIRWAKALRTLEADPLFAEASISQIADLEEDRWRDVARRTFRNLSSGHSVVLLAISRLVSFVEEQSLILLDEPEAHLHPPLISAFIRALSDLLTDRNGVVIVATHSPVVLQEVPSSCVWVLNRSGSSVRADRPEIETFGENVGTLTRQVFNLEVVNSGFHKMIAEAAEEGYTYEGIIRKFGNQLGAEARTLARALTSPTSNEDI
ncbi:AAA family ATPase [Rhizobium leguminosarum]|uniref:AAA family ATPase n=1 Tax=Rhizobium leguminosarum TaxID=384 RepID=UPI003F9D7AC7